MDDKNLLIAVAGSTPQIILETLYYYTQVEKIKIHEIHVITTTLGKEKIESQLIQNGRGVFFKFCQDYGLNLLEIQFCQPEIIRDASGNPLRDIRTVEDNTAAANQICNYIRAMSEKENGRLLCSLAGGRKTMSAYMALAMQFFGREQDRLSHVLIQPDFLENNPDFFYPPPPGKTIAVRDRSGKTHHLTQEDIRIDLAEIPFVRLRNKLKHIFRGKHLTYEEMVHLSQGTIDQIKNPPHLIYHKKKCKLHITGEEQEYEIFLEPKWAVFYHYLLLNPDGVSLQGIAEDLKSLYRTYRSLELKDQAFWMDDLMQLISKINRKIREEINDHAIIHYCEIAAEKSIGGKQYFLRLARLPECFKIEA